MKDIAFLHLCFKKQAIFVILCFSLATDFYILATFKVFKIHGFASENIRITKIS